MKYSYFVEPIVICSNMSTLSTSVFMTQVSAGHTVNVKFISLYTPLRSGSEWPKEQA